jgi:hypothetical protein
VKRALIGTAVVLVLAASGVAIYNLWLLKRQEKPSVTISRMRVLASLLESERPADVSQQTLSELVARFDHPSTLIDGWGRPFLVEQVVSEPGSVTFRIASLGRDGEKGRCCTPFVDSFDEDVVLEGGAWLQRWAP